MVDIKREDITLQDWTKGISADEFAWGSYFYSEWISSGYNSKGFELWYKVDKEPLNNRDNWYVVALAPTNSSTYWMLAFTEDGRIESEFWNNGASSGTWGEDRWWALYAAYDGSWKKYAYYNWLTRWEYAIWIKKDAVDIIDYENVYVPNVWISIDEQYFEDWGSHWTIGTWWTVSTDWAVHTPWTTDTLYTPITIGSIDTDDYFRIAIKIENCTAWYVTVSWWTMWWKDTDSSKNWWFVFTMRAKNDTTGITITPNTSFDGTITAVNVNILDQYNYALMNKVSLSWDTTTTHRPAVIWEWDLYIWCWSYVNIVNLSDWSRWNTPKELIDKHYEIVSITQQAWNLIIWATDGIDSRQYYWNWVDAVATEVIEWRWLIIIWVTWTETLSYVLTATWDEANWVFEYRLYLVSWYQRQLIASKLEEYQSWKYINLEPYNANKKFDFNDVESDRSMTVFVDSLYIPWCDWVYKYWYDIPWLRNSRTRPIKYDVWATHIIVGKRWNAFMIAYAVNWMNYICSVDNRLYNEHWYIVTNSIYRDKLSTRKALEKLKIWYKNLTSTMGNIKIYAIVDDTYFRRFYLSSTPGTRPELWAIYQIADDTTGRVIAVDKTNKILTFVTEDNQGSRDNLALNNLTKVSWTWSLLIAVAWYDNMIPIKTIESDHQTYGSDFVFWKDFVSSYIPYRYKIQFVIELNSNSEFNSPEVFEISIHSDITDTIL